MDWTWMNPDMLLTLERDYPDAARYLRRALLAAELHGLGTVPCRSPWQEARMRELQDALRDPREAGHACLAYEEWGSPTPAPGMP